MTEVRAAGFVIFRNFCNCIEYLLLQASYPPFHWTPPKGHVEAEESDLEAAFRETEEEAGLKKCDLTVTDYQQTIKYLANNEPKAVVYWLAELKNTEACVVLSKEHKGFKWCSFNDAVELAKYTEMQKLLQECDLFLKAKPNVS